MAVTTLVAIFKTEKDHVTDTSAEVRLSIVKTYKLLFRVITLPSIKMLTIILFTVNVGTYCKKCYLIGYCFILVTLDVKLHIFLINSGSFQQPK